MLRRSELWGRGSQTPKQWRHPIQLGHARELKPQLNGSFASRFRACWLRDAQSHNPRRPPTNHGGLRSAAVWQDCRSSKVPSRCTVRVFIVAAVIRSKTYMRPIYTVTRLQSARRSGRPRGLLPVIIQVSLDHLGSVCQPLWKRFRRETVPISAQVARKGRAPPAAHLDGALPGRRRAWDRTAINTRVRKRMHESV
jgi:hypothetical protein